LNQKENLKKENNPTTLACLSNPGRLFLFNN